MQTDNQQLPHAIFLMGPTASGKTDLALKIHEELPCEIISVDSAMVYRGMDIGTAKPEAEVLKKAPHRLIDVCDPVESYSAARFRADALAEMEEITASGRIPLLVGGTMLYFRALETGLSSLPSADPVLRVRLEVEAEEKGREAMHQRLAKIDPVSAKRIHPNDSQRIQRALEVYELEGKTLTELFQDGDVDSFPYRAIKVTLAPDDRAELHRRIADRFDAMLTKGFVDEVSGLFNRGDLDDQLPSMRAVGYRQIWEHLAGKTTLEQAVSKAIIATRQLAKRQLTWLRSEANSKWFDAMDNNAMSQALKYIVKATK